MLETLSTMIEYFQNSKLAGSYFMLYLVSIVLMYYLNRDKHKWFILYGIALMVVVVLNPITVWILSKAFPALAIYRPFTYLIPVFLYIPFTIAQLFDEIKEAKTRHILMAAVVFFISICGNLCGFYQKYTVNYENTPDEEKQAIVVMLEDMNPQMVLASQAIIPYLTDGVSNIPLLYGKDMWQYGMDTGIMDGYGEAERSLFFAMQDIEGKADYIADTAYECGCDIIVIDSTDYSSEELGVYELINHTDNYLIYRMK